MKLTIITITLLAILSVTSCTKDNAVHKVGNLIINSSFESNGQSSFQNWTGNFYSFVNDTPSNGGLWALQLNPGWVPDEGYAETFITGYHGNYSFIFSCDIKANDWTGQIIIRIENQNGKTTDLNSYFFNTASWGTIRQVVRASLQKTDKLIVHLSAGGTEVASGSVLFDNIYLEQL